MTYANLAFSNRMINKWNSLPNWVVSANTTNTFKARLDKFWHNQDTVYNSRAQLHGTGSRIVKYCVRNFSNVVYREVISRCGHRGFGLRS